MQGKAYRACRVASTVAWCMVALMMLYGMLLAASAVWEVARPESEQPLRVLGISAYTPLEDRWPSAPYFIGQLVQCALQCAVFWQAAALFGRVQEGKTPFAQDGGRRMRLAAVCMGLNAILPALADALTGSLYHGCPTMHQIDLGAAALAVLIWALAAVLDWGAKLQTQDDETL